MAEPKKTIEPWPVWDGYKIAASWWYWDARSQAYEQEHVFLSDEVYPTPQAAQEVIDSTDFLAERA